MARKCLLWPIYTSFILIQFFYNSHIVDIYFEIEYIQVLFES